MNHRYPCVQLIPKAVMISLTSNVPALWRMTKEGLIVSEPGSRGTTIMQTDHS